MFLRLAVLPYVLLWNDLRNSEVSPTYVPRNCASPSQKIFHSVTYEWKTVLGLVSTYMQDGIGICLIVLPYHLEQSVDAEQFPIFKSRPKSIFIMYWMSRQSAWVIVSWHTSSLFTSYFKLVIFDLYRPFKLDKIHIIRTLAVNNDVFLHFDNRVVFLRNAVRSLPHSLETHCKVWTVYGTFGVPSNLVSPLPTGNSEFWCALDFRFQEIITRRTNEANAWNPVPRHHPIYFKPLCKAAPVEIRGLPGRGCQVRFCTILPKGSNHRFSMLGISWLLFLV